MISDEEKAEEVYEAFRGNKQRKRIGYVIVKTKREPQSATPYGLFAARETPYTFQDSIFLEMYDTREAANKKIRENRKKAIEWYIRQCSGNLNAASAKAYAIQWANLHFDKLHIVPVVKAWDSQ